MRLGIVCSSAGNLGHASVARSLGEKARAHGGVRELFFISDQSQVLLDWSFFPADAELLSIGAKLPALDLLIIDAVPFRRAQILDQLLPALPQPWPRILIGHTGWGATLPGATAEQVEEWGRSLRRLRATSVLVYHPEELCGGQCDVAKLSASLGISVVHSGLLYPDGLAPAIEPKPNAFLVLSGGGAQSAVVVDRARECLQRLPGWRCDFVRGPFAEELAGDLDGMNVLTGVTDIARRLASYRFSITRTGYSACCEHIAAQQPAIAVPIEHPEQRANAAWLRRHVPSVSISDAGQLELQAPASPPPRAFHWRQVEKAVS
jgi:predicted glycosyltransferase